MRQQAIWSREAVRGWHLQVSDLCLLLQMSTTSTVPAGASGGSAGAPLAVHIGVSHDQGAPVLLAASTCAESSCTGAGFRKRLAPLPASFARGCHAQPACLAHASIANCCLFHRCPDAACRAEGPHGGQAHRHRRLPPAGQRRGRPAPPGMASGHLAEAVARGENTACLTPNTPLLSSSLPPCTTVTRLTGALSTPRAAFTRSSRASRQCSGARWVEGGDAHVHSQQRGCMEDGES